MNPSLPITHLAFVDESNWNTGRFRALGAISLKTEDYGHVTEEISKLLKESGVSELKWSKVTDAKYRFAAEKICKLVVECGLPGN